MRRRTARSLNVSASLAVALGACGLAIPEVGASALVVCSGVVGVIAVLAGVRVRRPDDMTAWLLFAVAMAAMLAGEIAATALSLQGEAPYPSAPEGFYLITYLACAGAVFRLARLRSHAADPTNLLDAFIVMGGIGTVVWLGVIVPTVLDSAIPPMTRATDALFMAVSLVVMGGVCRLAIGPGARNRSYYALAAAGASAVVAEVFIAFGASATGTSVLDVLNALATCGIFVFIAVSACHPSMRQLSERAIEPMGRMSGRRVGLIAGSTLVVPVSVVITWQGRWIDLAGILMGWLMISGSALVRVRGLVRSRERLSRTEQILRHAAASLAGSTTRPEMYQAALVATQRLVGIGPASATVPACIAEFDGDELRVAAAAAGGALFAEGAVLSLSHHEIAALQDGRSVHVRISEPSLADVHTVLLTPLVGRGYARGTLAVGAVDGVDEVIAGALVTLSSALVLAWDSAASIAEVERQRSERWFRSLVERSSDVIVLIDASGMTRFVSPAATRLLGLGNVTAAHFDLRSFVHPDDAAHLQSLLAAPASDAFDASQTTVRLRHQSGSWRWFDVVAADHRNDDALDGIVVTAREITDRKAAEERLMASEARFRSLVQHASDLVFVLEDSTSVRYASPSVFRLLGVPAAEILDRDLLSLVHPDDLAHFDRCRLGLGPDLPGHLEVRLRHRDVSWRTFEATLTDLRQDAAVAGVVFNAHDVTERKALEGHLRHRVAHDELTGLGNRVLLRERIETAFRRRREASLVDALLFIDLDDFKTVNDSLGHAAGDVLLQIVAHRILASVRPNETAVRLGGDEFALFVPAALPFAPLEIARRVLDVLAEPVDLAGREYIVEASIGIAISHMAEVTAEELLRNADAAMYHAKRQGKGRIAVFDERMHVDASDRLELKADLAHALRRNELLVHYQPIVDTRTSRTIGFEALIRWDHPQRGLVPPNSFIPLAEETGMICPIGRWLLDETMNQLKEFQAAHHGPERLNMSINLSARQLEEPSIVADIEAALHRSRVSPGDITIELTESCAVASEEALARLLRIRALGVQLAMDDFGTGEASYAALQTYPFTSVKVDRSILLGLGGPHHDRACAQLASIVSLAKQMGIVSLAEGVEGAAELAILKELGFDKAQGFYFGRPVTPAVTIVQLAEGRPTLLAS